MERSMKRIALAVGVLAAAAYSLVVGYKVEPVKQAWSGMADPDPDHGVSEVITVNFDLPITAALSWCTSGPGGDRSVGIRSYSGDIGSGLDVV
jgi:hypothetical protein